MKYTILIPIKPRKNPSMYETITKDNLLVGFIFESSTKVTGNNNSGKTPLDNGVIFVQTPDLYWIPLVYNGTIYVKEESLQTPSNTIDSYKPKKVTIENDGGIYVATDFTKI